MPSAIESLLAGNFTVLNLGSGEDRDLPTNLARCMTVIEVDALSDSKMTPHKCYRRISLRTAVAGATGKRLFHERKYSQCSSLLEPRPELVRDYALADYFELRGSAEVECQTIGQILRGLQIERLDFIKTDLEGLDFEILSSCSEIVAQTLVLQCELRFQPFYLGEPHFHTVAAYLSRLGFELITLTPEVWKLSTPHLRMVRDGRLVWADTVWFLSPERVRELFRERAALAFVKQAILARMLSLVNYSEFLYEQVKGQLSDTVRKELGQFVKPKFGTQISLNRIANTVALLPGGYLLLGAIRRAARLLASAATVYELKHVGSLWAR